MFINAFILYNRHFTSKRIKSKLAKIKSYSLMILFLIFTIFGSSIVIASSPDYLLTDLSKDNLNNGENDAGDLLFVYQDYKT